MVPVLHEIDIPHLDQRHRRERFAPLPRCGDAQPTSLVVVSEWIEVAVEITAPALTAKDPLDRHGSDSSVAKTVYCTGSIDLTQGQQAASRRISASLRIRFT
jgi:hypothetical protein